MDVNDAFQGNEPRPMQMSEWVAAQVRRHIYVGRLLPGSKLSEAELCENYDVSRNTLREAFAVLAGEALIRRIPDRGVFVNTPSIDDVRSTYRTRLLIESAAIMWGDFLPEALEQLDSIVDRSKVARKSGSIPEMSDANQDFHMALVALSGSPSLDALMEQCLSTMRLVFNALPSRPDFHSQYVDRNESLVAAIRRNRLSEAVDALQAYFSDAEGELIRIMESVRR